VSKFQYIPSLRFDGVDLLNWARSQFCVRRDKDLAELLGIHQARLSKIRHGRCPILPAVLVELLDASNLSLREMEEAVIEHRMRNVKQLNAAASVTALPKIRNSSRYALEASIDLDLAVLIVTLVKSAPFDDLDGVVKMVRENLLANH